MSKRKLVALALALAVTLSLSVPAMAATGGGKTVTGTGTGFGGDIVVTLTLVDGTITTCEIAGDDETPRIGGAALAELCRQVMTANGADIDGVSGATRTSNGVREAVIDALSEVEPDTDDYFVVKNGVLTDYSGYGGDLVIPDGVTAIGDAAFLFCDPASVVIPTSVTSIGELAFWYCSSLTSITIPDSVTFIGEGAFDDCDNLTIHGVAGSYAETYALENGIPFVADGDVIASQSPAASAPVKIATDTSFPDVDEDAPYFQAVEYVSGAGIMVGRDDGYFGPDNIVTRGEMATIICRMLGLEVDRSAIASFPDTRYHWAEPYIAAIAGLGIVNGYDDGNFGPSDTVTYEQAVTMLVRTKGWENEAVSQGGWPYGHLSAAENHGLLNGVSSYVGAPFTRGEVAQVVYNALTGQEENEPTGSTPSTSGKQEESEPSTGDTSAPTVTGITDLFAELNGKEFVFSSGAGAWETELTFGGNGTFTGSYHDSEMGEAEEEYPNGTVYFCDFSGQLSNAEKIDNLTYKVQLKTIEYENEPDEGWIENGIRYICTEPYGLEVADTFYLYLPGHSTDDLPGGFLEWVSRPNAWSTIPAEFPFWGLYNEAGDYGFYAES